ncbi:hypothetical protein [Mesorhizobium shangrilense]|uniref:Helix-turn-helix domain-containing protein n=1 Tax=Mesorhizobium shangrilense TaxID=460060 RepID=A0ABV2D7G9_9HYPH
MSWNSGWARWRDCYAPKPAVSPPALEQERKLKLLLQDVERLLEKQKLTKGAWTMRSGHTEKPNYVCPVMRVPKKGVGRPTTFRPEARQLAERGAMLVEIAAELGCTDRTISRWRLKYAEFRDALDRGRDRRAAELVANALEARRRDAEVKAAGESALREAALALLEMLKDIPVGIGKAPHHGTSEPAVGPVQATRDFDGEPTFHNFDGEPVPLDDPLADW